MTEFKPFNPYQAPNDPAPENPAAWQGAPSRCPASAGWHWLAQAWQFFCQAPGGWIGLAWLTFAAMFGSNLVLALIPMGGILANLVSTVLLGGVMLACKALVQQQQLNPGLLLQGFRETHFGRLLAVGGLYLAGTMAIFILALIIALLVFFMTGGSALFHGSPDPGDILLQAVVPIMIGGGLALLLLLPLLMAYFYAPVLVACHGLEATTAMKQSFAACLKNWLPLSILSLLLLAILIISLLPIGLAHHGGAPLGIGMWLLWAAVMLSLFSPIAMASVYTSYQAIFKTA